MTAVESNPAVTPVVDEPIDCCPEPVEPIALEPLHSNSPDQVLDSKTVSPRSRSRAFCKIKIEVGAQHFTTTKSTMAGSRLFSSFFCTESIDEKPLATPRTNMLSFIDNPNSRTFEEFMATIPADGSKKEKDSMMGFSDDLKGPPKIFEVERNHYFVDRSPVHFGRILHYLRNINTLNADQFLDRYYLSDAAAMGIHSQSQHSGSNASLYTLLLELQDEVTFYDIPSLGHSIEGTLSLNVHPLHSLYTLCAHSVHSKVHILSKSPLSLTTFQYTFSDRIFAAKSSG